MKRLFFLLTIFVSLYSWSQPILNYKIKMANNYYEKFLYGEAIPLYEEILHVEPANLDAKKRLANCYRQINDTRNAERVLSQLVVEDSVGLLNKLHYAQILSENGKYDEARKWYKKYDNAIAIDGRGKRFLTAYNNMKSFYKDSAFWSIEYLNINSLQSDFSPMYYQKGLIFCSARSYGGAVKNVFGWDQSAFLNIYYVEDTAQIKGIRYYTEVKSDKLLSYYDSTGHVSGHSEDTRNSGNDSHTLGYYGSTFLKEEEIWSEEDRNLVKPFNKSVNSKYHDGPASFSAAQDSMVLGHNNGKSKTSKDGTAKLKIYSARKIGEKWAKPNPIRFNKFQYYVKFTALNSSNKFSSEQDTAYVKEIELDDNQFSISHPCMNADNTKLFFVSDAPIGFGGTDIYVCDLQDGKWSAPINCGKNVNTEGNEMFPYVDQAGNLYFSSDGWGGMGGLDIYYSETETNIFGTKDNIFSRAQNMGFPVNSKKDDFGIISDPAQSHGYFSSNRRTGSNNDDIFRFKYIGPTTIAIDGMTVRKTNGQPLDSVRVTLRDVNNVLDSIYTPVYGKFAFKNLKPKVDYILIIEKPGYHSQKINLNTINLERGDTSKIKIEMVQKELFIYSKGTVFGEDDKKPMPNVKVKIYNNCTGQSEEVYTDSEGQYKIRLKENCCYAVSAIKDNCGVNSTVVSTIGIQESKELVNDFSMLCKGDVVKVENIYYDLGKYDIRPDAAAELDKLMTLLNKYPDMKIEIRAHTDSRGDDAKNLVLSDKRAKAVDDYLTSKGMGAARVVGKGYGETKPLNACKNGVNCSEEEYAVNRRTEFVILAVGKPQAQSKINALAANCQQYVEEEIKKQEEQHRETEKSTMVQNVLDVGQPNTQTDAIKTNNSIIEPKKEETKPVTTTKPVEVKKEETKPVEVVKTETKPVEPKKEETKPVTTAKPVEVKKEETKPVEVVKTETKPVEVKKEETKPVATTKPVEVKKEETKPVEVVKTETKPVEVKKEETKPVTTTKPVEVKKEETKPVEVVKTETKPVEVKKEETKPVTTTKPVEVKKEETKPVEVVKTETKPVEVKKEETKPVTTTKPVEVKKEETKPVTTTKPVEVVKTETKPVEVKKEEIKPVTTTKPVEVKKEETGDEDPFGDVLTRTEDKSVCTIKGVVLKNGSSEILNGVKLTMRTKDGKQVGTTSSVLNGTFTFTKVASLTDYEIVAEKQGFFVQKINVSSSVLQPGQTGNVKIMLDVDANAVPTTSNEVVITLKGRVLNATTKNSLSGIVIKVQNNIDKTVQEYKTDASGQYTCTLKKQAHFTITAVSGACSSDAINKSTIGVQSSQMMELDLNLKCP